MKKIFSFFIFILLTVMIIPATAGATDEEVNEAFENSDLVIIPHGERLPGTPATSDVSGPGENALDNGYNSEEVDDRGVFTYVYDVYYKGEKLDPRVIGVYEVSPTFTGYEPVGNEETQTGDSVAPERDEDGHCLGEYDIQGFSLGDNGSLKAPIKGSLSKENYEKIPVGRLIPADLTEPGRIRIAYDGTGNQNQDSVPYTGETYPLTFGSSEENIENPMYTVYGIDADGNEIILDKGYDYVGRAENNTGPTENYADKTTGAKPVLHGIYNYYGIYIPDEGDFYIKTKVTPAVQVIYKIGDNIVKQTNPSETALDIIANAPQVNNLAYGHAPNDILIAEPDSTQELTTVTVKGVLNGANGKDGVDGKDGAAGKNGADGKNGSTGKDGAKGDKGDIGAVGKDGINGQSAYEIAILNGFQGTEVEGLASLHGQEGKDGEIIIQESSPKASYPKNVSGKTMPATADNLKYSITLLFVCLILAVSTVAIVWSKTRIKNKKLGREDNESK